MQTLSQKKLKEILDQAFPDEVFLSDPQWIEGGTVNEVWRVEGKNRSYIVKHAPDHIASAPDVPLDPHRLVIEAEMLKLFQPDGKFDALINTQIRTPVVYHADYRNHLLIMEDVKPFQELDRRAMTGPLEPALGRLLGKFIGGLHKKSMNDPELRKAFDNRSIQQTRLEVQYSSAGALLKGTGIDDHKGLGRRAEMLGEKFLSTGRCLIMGDLWPRSVLVDQLQKKIRLIDWEFAHYGRPAQDIAHFAAHCWMMAHRAPDSEKRRLITSFWQEFMENYKKTLGSELRDLWDKEEQEDASIHFGCEVLVRTVGSFQEGYLYEGLNHSSAEIEETINFAASLLRNDLPGAFLFQLKLSQWHRLSS